MHGHSREAAIYRNPQPLKRRQGPASANVNHATISIIELNGGTICRLDQLEAGVEHTLHDVSYVGYVNKRSVKRRPLVHVSAVPSHEIRSVGGFGGTSAVERADVAVSVNEAEIQRFLVELGVSVWRQCPHKGIFIPARESIR